jgi:hypothetical protein
VSEGDRGGVCATIVAARRSVKTNTMLRFSKRVVLGIFGTSCRFKGAPGIAARLCMYDMLQLVAHGRLRLHPTSRVAYH